jgi:TRAP-type C4-dicarboxylate transport system substrate-binding protein
MFAGFLRAMGLAAVAFGIAAPVRAETIELKVSHYLPPSHTVQKYLEAWAETLDKRSDGRLKLKIYPASQLGPVQRQFDLARNGQADMSVGLTGATPGRYPMTELASLPFVWPSSGSTSEIMSKRLTQLAPKYLAGEFQGLRLLWVGVVPQNSFFTARKEVKGPADVKGLKLRFQGEQHAKLLRQLGAVPLQVPPGEVADGMSKGVIDGAIFNFEAGESFGLGSVTRYVVQPGFASATLALVMNNSKYDSLPPDLKAMIDDTSGPVAAEDLGRRWDAAEQHGRDTLVAQKVTLVPFAPAELDRLKTDLNPLVNEAIGSLEKASKPAQEFLDAYRK